MDRAGQGPVEAETTAGRAGPMVAGPPCLVDMTGEGLPRSVVKPLCRLVPDLTLLDAERREFTTVESLAICFVWLGDQPEIDCRPLERLIVLAPNVRFVALAEPPLGSRPALATLAATGRLHALHPVPFESGRLCALLEELRAVVRLELAAGGAGIRRGVGDEGEMVGSSPGMLELSAALRRVARLDAPVLIAGEKGTGKELAGRTLHGLSSAAAGPFVTVDCATLPARLIEAELLGYEPGAFSGARQRKRGRIEAAEGGTLFLDEIAQLPLEVQALLLRFLQSGTVTRLGGARTMGIGTRVVAATSANLERASREGRLNEDLFERLRALKLKVPPLRERAGDAELLARYFLRRISKECGRSGLTFSESASVALRTHQWPGNVRELAGAVRRAVVMAEDRLIGPADLGLTVLRQGAGPLPTLSDARQACEVRLIREALLRSGNNVRKASEMLGVSRVALYKMLKRYGLTASAPQRSDAHGLDDGSARA